MTQLTYPGSETQVEYLTGDCLHYNIREKSPAMKSRPTCLSLTVLSLTNPVISEISLPGIELVVERIMAEIFIVNLVKYPIMGVY